MQKKTYKKIFLIITILIISTLLSSTKVIAADEFNPNYIISDQEVLDANSMSLDYIRQFLADKGSYLVNYKAMTDNGVLMSAPEIIYNCARKNGVSPKFLIVLLQKEQSLVEESMPDKRALDKATGYGCPDNEACNPRWNGFYKQINSASLQFRDYMDEPELYKYQVGKTYTFIDNRDGVGKVTTVVTPANLATAGLYNYTPHVYNGNYNFWKIWHRYFSPTNYPDGSLLQAKGEVGVWLIENGKKRPFLTKGALLTRFDPKRIITVDKTVLDSYEKGAPIKFPQYSLIRSPSGEIFLLIDDKRHKIISGKALKLLGFNPEEIENASWQDVNAYKEDTPITASSTYPTGALLQNSKTGGVYWVINGTKAPLKDRIFLKVNFKNRMITPVSPEELKNFKTVEPVKLPNGCLISGPKSPAVYVISNGKKLPIASADVFKGLGYNWKNILKVDQRVLDLHPTGKALISVNK